MYPLLIGLLGVVILIGGSIMGIASLLLFPLVGIIALIAIVVWMAVRRAEHKPPMS
jgi:hypothetical protein